MSYLPPPQHTQPPAPREIQLWQCRVRDEGCCHLVGFCQAEKKTVLKNSASDQRVWRHRVEVYGKWKNWLSGQLSTRITQSIYLLGLCDPVSGCLRGRNTLKNTLELSLPREMLLLCYAETGVAPSGYFGSLPTLYFLWFCSVVLRLSTQSYRNGEVWDSSSFPFKTPAPVSAAGAPFLLFQLITTTLILSGLLQSVLK